MEKTCTHQDVYDDHHTAESVCIQCGLVLEKLYTADGNEPPDYFPEERNERKIFDFIKDICANAFFPKNIVLHAFNIFKKMKKEVKGKKFSDEAIAAFSIYNALHELETPRTPEEIEMFSGVAIGKIFEIAGYLNTTTISNDPTRYVDRYCNQLDLEYYDSNIIRVIVGNMYGMGNVKSNSLIATVIRLYCVEKQRKKIKLINICKVCRVSPASVHRIISLMDKKYVQNVTLLYA